MNDWEYTWDAIRTGTVTGPESAEKLERFIAEVERAAAEKGWWEGQRAGWEECADPGAFVNDLHDAKTPNPYRKEQ